MSNKNLSEIKSIKPRTISINLSDVDVIDLCTKAGSVNLTIEQLLENFIADLVCGTYTNGSDERMYATEWFERCSFAMFPDKSFLRYLIENGIVQSVATHIETMNDANEMIILTKENLKNPKYDWQNISDSDGIPCYEKIEEWQNSEKEFIDQEQETVDYCMGCINEEWSAFLEDVNTKSTFDFDEELKRVADWKKKLENLLNAK